MANLLLFFMGIYTGNLQSWSVPRLAEVFDVSTDVIRRVSESKFVPVRVHKGSSAVTWQTTDKVTVATLPW